MGDGSAGSPSLSFASEGSTGIYRGAAGQFDIAILGVMRLALTATGLSIVGNISANSASFSGTVNALGGVLGGTF